MNTETIGEVPGGDTLAVLGLASSIHEGPGSQGHIEWP